MAISRMNKISLIFHRNEKGKIFKKLTQLGTVELVQSKSYNETIKTNQTELKSKIEEKIQKLEFAFSFLKSLSKDINLENANAYKKLKKEKKNNSKNLEIKIDLGKINRVFDYEYLESYVDSEYELFSEISNLEEISLKLVELKNQKGRLELERTAIKKYEALDIKFSEIKNTNHVKISVGLVETDNLKNLVLPQNVFLTTKIIDKQSIVVILSLIRDMDELNKKLIQVGFQSCPYNDDVLPAEKINKINEEIFEIEEEIKRIKKEAINAVENISAYKFLYDFYTLELAKQEAIEESSLTKHTIILEGWVPRDKVEITKNELSNVSTSTLIFIEEPKEGEIVPSYFINNKIVEPFSKNITAMYGAPEYNGIDPNPFVAFFYILFFGFMLGDVGYGAILTLGCALFLLIKKPVKDSGSFIKMFMLCGFSCIIWGVIFGSYFGLEESAMTTTAFGKMLWSMKKLDSLGVGSIVIFALALVMGIIQIAVGFVLNGVQKIKDGKVIDGILNDFSWVVIFLGGGIFALSIVVKSFNNLQTVKTVGIVVALIGLIMLLAGGAVGKKKILSMFTGAFSNLYGSVNVISDVLSYSRLFGLSLTTGVIALVFNRIGLIVKNMVGGGVFGFMIAIIIWVVGHAFNMGINLLSVYVHNSRLQYVEFFGKFYSGEGHAFAPFGHKTRFTYLDEKLTMTKKSRVKV
ncbi:MAG: V-type ATP synthase subunit I [Christensenellales bacterium]|jgi:V/A-type H+-transporting ATPase subunit I|nr:V-type ATP synthase subunit I [Clostridiales bacterium]